MSIVVALVMFLPPPPPPLPTKGSFQCELHSQQSHDVIHLNGEIRMEPWKEGDGSLIPRALISSPTMAELNGNFSAELTNTGGSFGVWFGATITTVDIKLFAPTFLAERGAMVVEITKDVHPGSVPREGQTQYLTGFCDTNFRAESDELTKA